MPDKKREHKKQDESRRRTEIPGQNLKADDSSDKDEPHDEKRGKQ
jgi:hypothetical protein